MIRYEDHKFKRADKYKDGLLNLINYCINDLNIDNENFLEIGVYMGDSVDIFSKHFKNIYAIDPWDMCEEKCPVNGFYMSDVEKFFDENVLKNNSNVTKIKNFSHNVCNNYADEFFNMIYVDGSHIYKDVLKDLQDWSKKVKVGGVISGHDYDLPQVYSAIMDFFKKPPLKTFEDSSWVYLYEK